MQIQVETNNGYRRLLIDGDINIYTAHELKRQLFDYLASATEIEISLAQAGEIDTAGFQVLYLIKREAVKSGKTLYLTSHSPMMLKIMGLYNMTDFFVDPVVISGTRKKVRAPRPKTKAKRAT